MERKKEHGSPVTPLHVSGHLSGRGQDDSHLTTGYDKENFGLITREEN
jgi:hypothetical protein